MTNNVKKIWASGKTVVNAWLAIPSGFSAEVIAQCGFEPRTRDVFDVGVADREPPKAPEINLEPDDVVTRFGRLDGQGKAHVALSHDDDKRHERDLPWQAPDSFLGEMIGTWREHVTTWALPHRRHR